MKKYLLLGTAAIFGLFAVVGLFGFFGLIEPGDVPAILGFGSMAAIGLGMVGGSTAPAPANGQRFYSFRENTRQKIGKVGTMTYSLGGQQFLTLPKIGYVSKIWLRFSGSITSTSAGVDTITYADFGPWSTLRNIQLDLNSGKQILANVSGYELFLINSVRRTSGRSDQQTDSDFYAAPTSGSAQNFRFTLEIPVSVSDGQNFQVGLINLQAPELQMNLTVNFANALADIGSNISTLTGTVDVFYQYYEIPDPSIVMQPYVALHKILSQVSPVGQTGENVLEIPRGGDLLRMIHVLYLNGDRSDAYDSQKLRLNKTQDIYTIDRWLGKYRNRERYGYNLPTGTIVWDFQNGWDLPEESDLRDVIDTERATTTESIITVTSGSTLGTNNNFLYTIREFIQVPAA